MYEHPSMMYDEPPIITSYCTCGFYTEDDGADSKFHAHISQAPFSEHRMCSFHEWCLCKHIFELQQDIQRLQTQLADNCSKEVVLLSERLMHLEEENQRLKEENQRLKEENQRLKEELSSSPNNAPSGTRLSNRRNRKTQL